MTISIIIPAFNEEKTIKEIIDKIINLNFGENIDKQIIVINDCSIDNTQLILDDLIRVGYKIKVVVNEKNIGKSRSVIKGILLSNGEYVVIQDADLEYDPNDIVLLYKHIYENSLDFAYGNRFNGKNKIIYKSYYWGNKMLSLTSNFFTLLRLRKLIPDMEVCYKMVKGEIVRSIASKMTSNSNFGFEPEITAKLSRYKVNNKHLSFGVIPIKYFPRSIEQGKKIKYSDGLKAFIEIVKYNTFS